jgi:hypothetical protein
MVRLAAVFGTLLGGSFVATTAQAQQCVPECRDWYMCIEGACVEACNPACPEGEQCVAGGQCVPKASPEPTYTSVNTGTAATAVDSGGKPSVALPATFVSLGGFFLIAGGVTFGTSEWDGYYGEYWGTGQWVGVGLMTMGAIMVATATPFLAIRIKERKDWERRQAGIWGDKFVLAPAVTPMARTYGVTFRGRF